VRLSVNIAERDVERFKSSFYRFLETKLEAAPEEAATPAISVSGEAAEVTGGQALWRPEMAEEFISYWRRTRLERPMDARQARRT
jgi:hypothetical protein